MAETTRYETSLNLSLGDQRIVKCLGALDKICSFVVGESIRGRVNDAVRVVYDCVGGKVDQAAKILDTCRENEVETELCNSANFIAMPSSECYSRWVDIASYLGVKMKVSFERLSDLYIDIDADWDEVLNEIHWAYMCQIMNCLYEIIVRHDYENKGGLSKERCWQMFCKAFNFPSYLLHYVRCDIDKNFDAYWTRLAIDSVAFID